ncbi:MAG: hypothetical protein HDR03_10935 [Lachnospiraceae bacterium]|nr:hypothetical protein [Lachnospiraceae bacterium]
MKKAGKIIAVIIGLCVAAAIVFYISRPYSDAVTISGIERGAHCGALVKSGGVYYELQASDSFAELFAFDEWKYTRKKLMAIRQSCFDLPRNGLLRFILMELLWLITAMLQANKNQVHTIRLR